MNLHEEFKLYEKLWDEEPQKELSSRKYYSKTINRPTVEQYFNEITSSKDAAINFIKTELTKYKNSSTMPVSNIYARAIAKATRAPAVPTDNFNYKAFIAAIDKYGLTAKDVRNIYDTGAPRISAVDAFLEKTASVKAVQAFMQQLKKEYADELGDNKQGHRFAYTKWFIYNTNATSTNYYDLVPESASWNSFVETCRKKFGLSVRDLAAFYWDRSVKAKSTEPDTRAWITTRKADLPSKEEYFKSITKDRSSVIAFVKEVLAPYEHGRARPDLSSSYCAAIAGKTSATGLEIGRDNNCNYKAFRAAIIEFGIGKKYLDDLINDTSKTK